MCKPNVYRSLWLRIQIGKETGGRTAKERNSSLTRKEREEEKDPRNCRLYGPWGYHGQGHWLYPWLLVPWYNRLWVFHWKSAFQRLFPWVDLQEHPKQGNLVAGSGRKRGSNGSRRQGLFIKITDEGPQAATRSLSRSPGAERASIPGGCQLGHPYHGSSTLDTRRQRGWRQQLSQCKRRRPD